MSNFEHWNMRPLESEVFREALLEFHGESLKAAFPEGIPQDVLDGSHGWANRAALYHVVRVACRRLATAQESRLAAELEVARLREGLEESRSTAHADIAKARETAKDGCGLCRELALHLARCHSVLTVASPPDLGPLRELVAAWRGARLQEVIMPARLADALDAVLARYPFLGERP